MADNELKIKIGADFGEVPKAVSSVLSSVKTLGDNINKSFDSSAKSLNNFKVSTDAVSKSLSSIPTGFNTAGITQGSNSAVKALNSIKEAGETITLSLGTIPRSFDEISAGSAALARINAAIDESANRAINASGRFEDLAGDIGRSIQQIGSSGAGITQVTAAINELAATALKAGDGFLAIGVKTPIQDITVLRNNIQELKKDLTTGFKPILNVVDPRVPALLNSVSASLTNISPAIQRANAAISTNNISASIEKTARVADAASQNISTFSTTVLAALARLESGTGSVNEVTAAINKLLITASQSGENLISFGVQAPIQDIAELRTNVEQLKNDLATGFKPIVNLVDPNIPPLLNSISASLTNISPAVNQAGNALRTASGAADQFAVSVNKSVTDALVKFDQFKTEALGLGTAFNKIPASLKPFNTSAIVALRGAVGGLKKDVEGLRFTNITSQLNTATAAAAKTGAAFKSTLRPGAASASAALTDVGRVLQDLPFGFVSIQNNLTQLPQSFRALSLAAKESGQSIGKVLLSSLTGAGGIGLALSAVTAAVTFATVGFGAWSRMLGGSSKAAQEAADKTQELLDSIRSVSDIKFDAAGSVQAQIIQVEGLARAVQDVTKSDKERGRALEDLKTINKNYFGDLDLGVESLRKISAATEAYTNALIQQAIIGELEGEIGKVGAAYLRQSSQVNKLSASLAALRKQQETNAPKLKTNEFFIDETQAGKELSATIAVLEKNLRDAQQVLNPLAAQFSGLKGELEGFNEEALKLKPLKVDSDGTTKKVDGELKELKNTLQGYRKELAQINDLRKDGFLPKFKEDDALKLQQQINDVLEKIDTREVKLGLKPTLEIDQDLADLELKRATEEYSKNIKLATIDFPVELFPRLNKNFTDRLHDAALRNAALNNLAGIDLELPLDIDFTVSSNVTEAFKNLEVTGYNQGAKVAKGVSDGIADQAGTAARAAADLIKKIDEEFEKGTTQIINQSITNLGTSVGDALGAALGGGESFNGIEVLLNTLGEALREMGKAMIAAGVAKLGIDKALKAFGGAGMIASGVLSVAIGAAIKASIAKIPKFAEGGIATGATLGIFGERGTEAIIPLDRLNEFIDNSGGSQRVEVYGAIHNDVIVLSNKRGLVSQGRRFGV